MDRSIPAIPAGNLSEPSPILQDDAGEFMSRWLVGLSGWQVCVTTLAILIAYDQGMMLPSSPEF